MMHTIQCLKKFDRVWMPGAPSRAHGLEHLQCRCSRQIYHTPQVCAPFPSCSSYFQISTKEPKESSKVMASLLEEQFLLRVQKLYEHCESRVVSRLVRISVALWGWLNNTSILYKCTPCPCLVSDGKKKTFLFDLSSSAESDRAG